MATDLTSNSTLGTRGLDIDCMESGKWEQLFRVKPLFDLNRFCHVVVVCTLFGLGADNHESGNWVFQDINSRVAVLASNTIIRLGIGTE